MKEIIPSFTSPEEYLVIERTALLRHEYYDGEIMCLAGASMAHNRILVNLLSEVRALLKDKPCEILPNEVRVVVPSGKFFMYPDASIVCGEPEMSDAKFDTLKNPRVIIEILSSSTAKHDRVRKFGYYKMIPSFVEYILIDSVDCWVEASLRRADGSWETEGHGDPDGYLRIRSIKASVPLREIYRKVWPERLV